eukprot:gene35351-47504_t
MPKETNITSRLTANAACIVRAIVDDPAAFAVRRLIAVPMVAPSHHVKILPRIPMHPRLRASTLRCNPYLPYFAVHLTLSPAEIPNSADNPPRSSNTAPTGSPEATGIVEYGIVFSAMLSIVPFVRTKTMSGTYTPDSYHIETEAKSAGNGPVGSSAMTIDARRVGACRGTADENELMRRP